jgi:PAS domain S-box-containing protein
MKTQARQVTGAYLDGLIADAKRGIVAQGIVLVLAFILCAFSFRVIIFRVIRPINGMVDALMRATRGEPVAIEPRAGLQDEISKLTHVLHVFQQKGEEIRRTSAELSRSQTHLRAVVDYALDGLITTNAIGTVTSFNAASERIFGYPSGEMIGRNIEILMPLATLVVDGPASLNVGPTGPASGEGVARRKDGTVCPVELSVSTFWLEDGQHFSAIIRDIAQRKKAEAQLMHHTHALERSNRELDDFAYIASHDLKEPLRGIHNHSRFLLEDNADKLDQESVGRLNRLVYLTQRMERLINDLLYFSRLGRQELAIQATDIAAVVHDIEATLEQFLQERRARITLPRSLAPVICDKPRVTELLRNLITNAVKYNDKAEKVVEIGGLDRYPTPDGTLARNVFYVKDNGLGIAPEFHDDIFRIFKRLQAAGEGEEGTGVGLTFVKKIVERHGGRIWLESEPGKGTTFYFTLEALEHDAEAGTEAA